MKMVRGMLVGRLIAAAHMAARQTHAQMHPMAADFETIFAARGAGNDIVDLVEVCTGHQLFLSWLKGQCG